jgi:hypothetical protein
MVKDGLSRHTVYFRKEEPPDAGSIQRDRLASRGRRRDGGSLRRARRVHRRFRVVPRRRGRDAAVQRASGRPLPEPPLGYVVRGSVTFLYADHDEVYKSGDAYYAPPGHVPVVAAGTEIVEFSPTEEYARTMEVLGRNLAAMAES